MYMFTHSSNYLQQVDKREKTKKSDYQNTTN